MSARNIYDAIDGDKYSATLCYIDIDGRWRLVEDWVDKMPRGSVQLLPIFGEKRFETSSDHVPVPIDVILPVIHGPTGEDGVIAGIGQLLHVPVVGCDTLSSAVCWDKLLTKTVLAANSIRVAPFIRHDLGSELPDFASIKAQLGAPVFVKPTRAGSSVGVHKVHDEQEFKPAIDDALLYSDTVLIEKNLSGRELEVAVLGNPPHHQASGVGEIVPGEEFYSYEDKYAASSTAQVVPNADIDEKLSNEIRDMTLKAYAATGCRGLARVDFLTDEDGVVYLNEINTFPGFTNISQYPKLWQEQGIGYTELIDRLIQLALETNKRED